MGLGSGLTAQPLTPGHNFNWIFLVELLVSGILALFFLFYFNRLFATLVSYGLRAYTWHKYKVYVDIESLQLSLLGGRLFFKGVSYHGVNETVFIHNGHITWRYWLSSVKQVDYSRFRPQSQTSEQNRKDQESSSEASGAPTVETGGIEREDRRPCRIAVYISGLEWFIYNRTPGYDAILKGSEAAREREDHEGSAPEASGFEATMAPEDNATRRRSRISKQTQASDAVDDQRHTQASDFSYEDSILGQEKDTPTLEKFYTAATDPAVTSPREEYSLSFLGLLPVLVECTKGAIILGNEHTKVLLTSTFESVEGEIDASHAGPLDVYRQMFKFDITHPHVQMRPNPDFKMPQNLAAERIADQSTHVPQRNGHRFPKWHVQRRSRRAFRSLRNLVPYFQKSVESFRPSSSSTQYDEMKFQNADGFSGGTRWLGLNRYLEEDERDDHEGWGNVEYARNSTVLDCPSIKLNFYWDIPGPVQTPYREDFSGNTTNISHKVNGADQPGYGMDVNVRGGVINYGPWADRARAEVQTIFFPNAFQDAVPTMPLKAGETRLSTTFVMHVDIEEEVSVRIPTREDSKDWQWKGRADAIRGAARLERSKSKRHGRQKKGEKSVGPEIRPFGWLDLAVEADSTVSFEMDMYPGKVEYSTHVDVDLKGTRMTSSVNHGLLWRCGPQIVSCDLPNPIGWNTLRDWTFKIHSQSLEFFILRDHMFLLTDLINDWSTGPPPEYLTFVPFKYRVSLDFSEFKIYLNTNDANIIDDPSDLTDNTFIVIGAQSLTSKLEIPLDIFRPSRNSISFEALMQDARLDLITPLWSTYHTFVDDEPMATLKRLDLDGSYNYCLGTSPAFTDSLFMNMKGLSPRMYIHGFLIRYFTKVKDNYFGDDLHFRTLAEFQEMLAANAPVTSAEMKTIKKDNDLDVILSVQANKVELMLPANIYAKDKHIKLDVLLAEADMRFTNYYMDMAARFSPIEASLEATEPMAGQSHRIVTGSQLFVDGLDMYGHRLFGLPPSEPTYVCNWDFHVGKILGECSTAFLQTMISGIRALDFSLDDYENALPVAHAAVLHDVTFLRATVDSVRIWVLVGDAALLLGTGSIEIDLQDWADVLFSERLHVRVPDIKIASVDIGSANFRHEEGAHLVPTTSAIATSLDLMLLEKAPDFARKRALQSQHIRIHDQRTARIPWMIGNDKSVAAENHKSQPPAMPVPSMPAPLRAPAYRQPSKPSERKSSFLSLDSLRKRDAQVQPREAGPERKKRSSQSEAAVPGVPSSFKNRMRNGHQSSRPAVPSSSVTFSSPWAPPHFSLANIEPDLADLPRMLGGNRIASTYPVRPEYTQPYAVDEDIQAGHNNIICTFGSGLVCFFNPEVFHVVSNLLQDMSLNNPTGLLDDLQMESIATIVKLKRLKSKPPKPVDFQLRLPYVNVRAINSYHREHRGVITQERDVYSVTLTNSLCTARTSAQKGALEPGGKIAQRIVLHVVSEEASLTISERSANSQHDKAAVHGLIKDMALWMATGGDVFGNLQVRSVDVATWSRKVEYLAALIHRSTAVVETTVRDIETGSRRRGECLKNLVYQLTLLGKDGPDPAFLIRPSYVLRTATDHLRTNDSWKIISRLRYIYHKAPLDKQKLIQQQNASYDAGCPEDAQAHVLDSFDQWRAWDLASVNQSIVMQVIWGTKASIAEPQSNSTQLTLSIGSTKLLLDPGPKQNEVALGDLSFFVSIQHPRHGNGGSNPLKQTIRIRNFCSKIAVRLNWEICDLLKDTLELFKDSGKPEEAPKNISSVSSEAKPSPDVATDFHFVFGTDYGIITLDSVNLKIVMATKAFKGSVVHQLIDPSKIQHNTILLSTTSASAELVNHGRALMVWRLKAPNLYSYVSPVESDSTIMDLKLAANCEKIHYNMTADVASVAEVVDKFVQDEVSFVLALSKELREPKSHDSLPLASPRPKVRFAVAMFLDNYQLSFCLLPSLTYIISGEIARTSVAPRQDGGLGIDFDLQRHSHNFHSSRHSAGAAFSTLKLPPINGRFSLFQKPVATVIVADLSIEKIHLDGGAIQALVDVGGRPEMVDALDGVQASLKTTRSRLETLLQEYAHSPRSKTPIPSTALLYRGGTTLAGLSISATAPAVSAGNTSADLEFSLSMVRVALHNHRGQEFEPFQKPQFDVLFRQVSLDLRHRMLDQAQSYGSLAFAATASGRTEIEETGTEVQAYRLASGGLNVNLYPETASLVTRIAAHLQERIGSLDLSLESKPVQKLRRFTRPELFDRPKQPSPVREENEQSEDSSSSTVLLDSTFSVELAQTYLNWIITEENITSAGRTAEDLVLSIKKIDFTTKRENSARLAIDDLQLQMLPKASDTRQRTMNSALLPEVVFNVAYLSSHKDWRVAFQAAGKALDLRLTSDFIVPANALRISLASASEVLRSADTFKSASSSQTDNTRAHVFGSKRLSSLLVDADFAGAVVTIQERPAEEHMSPFQFIKGSRRANTSRYGQFVQDDQAGRAILRSPGVAFKLEFQDRSVGEPSLNAEVKVSASKNILNPTIVPLILEISSSVKEVVGDSQPTDRVPMDTPKSSKDGPIGNADPSAILGKTKLNLGLWVQGQEFSLTCQPVARVAATARCDDIFMTVNTVQSQDQHRFFAMLLSLNSLSASVQHVYSRESTASFDVKSITVSMMNSKHVSANSNSGISAIVNISPMRTMINAKQVQDFLLFREIWYPPEMRRETTAPAPTTTSDSQAIVVQRYQQVAAAGAFPWNTIISVDELAIEVDLGQSLGKTNFSISKLWTSMRKSSDLEQNLCLGFEKISIESTGRMSGSIELQNLRVRTSIRWPSERALGQTPLVQASAGFDGLKLKTAFDYQPFLIADITSFEFLMYNVREEGDIKKDRLVGILEGDKIQVFWTTASASLGLALYQAFLRLVQEKQAAYEASIKELDRFLRRKSAYPSGTFSQAAAGSNQLDTAFDPVKSLLTLHTDVMVTLKAVNIGAFPSTFFDNQIFKVEASNAQARFGVSVANGRTHSGLGLTLGQLRVALSAVTRSTTQAFGEVEINHVVTNATGSRGGTILKVPKVIATMETWQTASSNHIDYIFKSKFEGKVDVGWNYSRISFIRGMWVTHSKALADRLGKPLPQSALRITGGPQPDDPTGQEKGQEKITAVVNVPQSRFDYTALEPPIIETPQLRDMGEATPPLEWIGLHRDRLPNLTHQIIIVTLLEVAKEVEDAYSRILGSS